MSATSKIRRKYSQGVTPSHILYMAMKTLRLRVTEGLYTTFRRTKNIGKITKKIIEYESFIKKCLDNNLSYLKSIPNSMRYWCNKKKDLFAMLRQLGKPTLFITLSSSEYKWKNLLNILYKLKYIIKFLKEIFLI